MRVDRVVVGEYDGPLDAVAQLADVSRPLVGEERFEGGGGEVVNSPPGLGGKPGEEMAGQRLDVLAPPPQRRHDDLHNFEAEIEIAAELVGCDRILEIAVGSRDDADVDLHPLAAADTLERMPLENAEKLRLDRLAHLADLVEEQRSPMSGLKLPRLPFSGAGKGALLVPEQLALEERFGERRAVEADKRRAATVAGIMDRPGDELLARATLPAHQHRGLRRCDAGDLAGDGRQRRTSPHHP